MRQMEGQRYAGRLERSCHTGRLQLWLSQVRLNLCLSFFSLALYTHVNARARAHTHTHTRSCWCLVQLREKQRQGQRRTETDRDIHLTVKTHLDGIDGGRRRKHLLIFLYILRLHLCLWGEARGVRNSECVCVAGWVCWFGQLICALWKLFMSTKVQKCPSAYVRGPVTVFCVQTYSCVCVGMHVLFCPQEVETISVGA
jgi:hypothetical protein